ncbi:hypothetical protein SAMN05660662_0125 [Blastococcus aurantiacus]|uniref:MinD-like ATPase involved in chromosome partitioning or flagellar assembly n=1 Tax=Blastococcus aurantiacus TaxID=1550231 RepID=A0A1G7R1E9_9ACTN|nr:hypothetical protein [Blastococcus aurantiacus]SDG04534.1 hypothetical protein SAMN05660662_0125 [Blastococcus aurantiacus]
MTIEAMRAAVVAIRAGVFDDIEATDIVAEASRAVVVDGVDREVGVHRPWLDGTAGGSVALVLAAHGGAGASTVALAVAEALTDSGRVHLLDFGEPIWSGLAAAASIELGSEGAFWWRGRRGRLDLSRLARHRTDGGLPSPPELDGGARRLVVDAGWALTTALLQACSNQVILLGEQVVVVTRVTVPAVRQTERALTAVGNEAVVAAVGPARWPRAVEASCGPRLAELRALGRVVRVPIDRRLEVSGLTGDRLPAAVAAAGRSLAVLLAPATSRAEQRRRAASPQTEAAGETR